MLTLKKLFILAAASLLTSACGDGAAQETSPMSGNTSSIQGYGSNPNGTGVHVGSTQPESWFGLANVSLTWFMTGLSMRPDGSVWANGWYNVAIGVAAADARVLSAQHDGQNRSVVAVRTAGTRLSIDLRAADGHIQTLTGDDILGVSLLLRVPDPTGLIYTNYRLRFRQADALSSRFDDVDGYQMEYKVDGLLGGPWTAYCKGPGGEAQHSVFYQGAQWNPLNGARSDGDGLVAMTCESGAVATCMRWGYRPWASAPLGNGHSTGLGDYHQACVHMKRASYCGDSKANTVDGTLIVINDPFAPAINSGPADDLEALWTPTGATCIGSRRRPEIPFLGCPLPLPTCPENPSGGFLLSSALP